MSITSNEQCKELRNRLSILKMQYAMLKSRADDTELSIIEKEIKAVDRELGQILFSLKDNERNKSKEGELLK